MSLKYEIDGFEEKTYERLFKQQEKVGEGITPDNINYIDYRLIGTERFPDIEFLYGSSINGYSINNMYEIIAYLKTNKIDRTSISKSFQILSDKSEFEIEIPDSYDGRNSFVLCCWNRRENIDGGRLLGRNLDPRFVINASFKNKNGNSEPYNQTFFVTKNKRNIKLNMNNYDFDGIDDGFYYDLKVLVLLWRFV